MIASDTWVRYFIFFASRGRGASSRKISPNSLCKIRFAWRKEQIETLAFHWPRITVTLRNESNKQQINQKQTDVGGAFLRVESYLNAARVHVLWWDIKLEGIHVRHHSDRDKPLWVLVGVVALVSSNVGVSEQYLATYHSSHHGRLAIEAEGSIQVKAGDLSHTLIHPARARSVSVDLCEVHKQIVLE